MKRTRTEFQITPKGMLAVAMLNLHPSINLDQANAAIAQFEARIRKRARADFDEQRGVPCIVMEGGWHVITTQRTNGNT